MSKTLRWWLFFCISLTTMGIAHYFGMFAELYEKDVTKISFAIIGLYVFTSLYIGKLTLDYKNGKDIDPSRNRLVHIRKHVGFGYDWNGCRLHFDAWFKFRRIRC